MDRPADNHFRCSECETPCDLYFDGTDEEPVNCSFQSVGRQNWKRVEQSPKGEIMKHVPVIHEKKSEAAENKWEYAMEVAGGCLNINAVDSKTGRRVAFLYEVVSTGELRAVSSARTVLGSLGYSAQGLQFESDGRAKVG